MSGRPKEGKGCGGGGRLLITDNVLRPQFNPVEQARLIQRLKDQYGIKRGNPHQEVNYDKMSQLTPMAGVTNERQARRLNQLNALIPPLQATAFPPSASCLSFRFTILPS